MPVRPGYLDVVPPSLNLERSQQQTGVGGTQIFPYSFHWTVPDSYYAQLIAVTGIFQLDGTVHNRQLLFTGNVKGVDIATFQIVSSGDLTANANGTFYAGTSLTAPSTSQGSVYMPLPPVLYTPGSLLAFQIQNAVGADLIAPTPVVVWNLYLYDSSGDSAGADQGMLDLVAPAPA